MADSFRGRRRGKFGGCAAYKCRRAVAGTQAGPKKTPNCAVVLNGAANQKRLLSLQLKGCPFARG